MSDSFSMTGTVIMVGPIQDISEKFSKRSIRIDNGAQYGNIVEFEFTNDKMNLVEDHLMDKEVLIRFNIEGREWKDRCFTSCRGWHLEQVVAPGQQPQTTAPPQQQEVEQDDLPF